MSVLFNRFTLGTSAPKWPALLSGIKLGAGAGRGVEKSPLIPQLSATARLQVLLASRLDRNNGAWKETQPAHPWPAVEAESARGVGGGGRVLLGVALPRGLTSSLLLPCGLPLMPDSSS